MANRQQKKAISAPASYLQILAGPGTGKTYTLIERVVHMINTGIPACDILVLTFTNAAAREVKQRVQKRLKCPKNRLVNLQVYTFHGLAVRLMHMAGSKVRIADDSDIKLILKRIVGDAERVSSVYKDIVSARSLGHDCPYLKEYQQELDRLGVLDFEGLLIKLLEYTKTSSYVSSLKAVFVDEFQDTSVRQLDIAIGLASSSQNLTVVGDPDQSIYGWRFANVQNFTEMRKRCPNTQVVILEENYRSGKEILKAASKVITQDADRVSPERQLVATQVWKATFLCSRFHNERAEVDAIVECISMLVTCGVSPSSIAVLGRLNRQLEAVEAKLITHTIKTRVLGGLKIMQRTVVKLIICYLLVAVYDDDEMAIAYTINTPPRGIGEKTLDMLFKGQVRKSVRHLRHHTAKQGVEKYLQIIRRCRKLLDPQTPESLIATIEYLSQEVCEPSPSTDEFTALLTKSVDSMDLDGPDSLPKRFLSAWQLDWSTTKDNSEQVTLTTMHSAKGLEWPIVFLFNWDTQLVSNEEIRLYYVAMTRAKCMLSVSGYLEPPSIYRSLPAKRVSLIKPDMKVLCKALGIPERSISKPTEYPGFSSALSLVQSTGPSGQVQETGFSSALSLHNETTGSSSLQKETEKKNEKKRKYDGSLSSFFAPLTRK